MALQTFDSSYYLANNPDVLNAVLMGNSRAQSSITPCSAKKKAACQMPFSTRLAI
jgi:hypothetical protein